MEATSGLPPIPLEEIERLLGESAPVIQRYVAIVYLQGDCVFSGVYAKSFGYEGILTAGHCASQFLAEDHFGLVVTDSVHRFWVEPKHFEHVPIAYDETEGYTSDGPDLSFVIIRDPKLLRVIHGIKLPFYDLDNQKIKEVFGGDIGKFNWSVAGSPREKVEVTQPIMNGKEIIMAVTTSAVIQGNLAEMEIRNDFDYIKLHLITGFEEFPDSYNGVSGGGIWYQRFVEKEDKTFVVEPTLAGVVCWQSVEPITRRGVTARSITGHGYLSVYGRLRRVLMEKRLAEDKNQSTPLH